LLKPISKGNFILLIDATIPILLFLHRHSQHPTMHIYWLVYYVSLCTYYRNRGVCNHLSQRYNRNIRTHYPFIFKILFYSSEISAITATINSLRWTKFHWLTL